MTRKTLNRSLLTLARQGTMDRTDCGSITAALRMVERRVGKGCEWFDFGDVSWERDVTPTYAAARGLIEAGLYIPPFDNFVFECRVSQVGSPTASICLVSFNTSPEEGFDELECGTNVIVQMCDPGMGVHIPLTAICLKVGKPNIGVTSIRPAEVLVEDDRSNAPWTKRLLTSLWLILNTKGVSVVRKEPSAGLQLARWRSGKPPAQAVTYVDTRQYAEAMAATVDLEAGRKHASPRPHLRRAHLLQTSAGIRMRRGCIVGAAQGSPLQHRDHYTVRGN